jgi:Cyclin, N-terminal domain
MDRVLPGLSLNRERYRLLSAACLLIAGKYEEEEAKLPAPDTFRAYLGGTYTAETLAQAEILLLEKLHWSCTAITPLSFLGHFYSQVRVWLALCFVCVRMIGSFSCVHARVLRFTTTR